MTFQLYIFFKLKFSLVCQMNSVQRNQLVSILDDNIGKYQMQAVHSSCIFSTVTGKYVIYIHEFCITILYIVDILWFIMQFFTC